eukprot:SAG22_NODE_1877_length_3383_cov_2.067905_4_plen_217_part_00
MIKINDPPFELEADWILMLEAGGLRSLIREEGVSSKALPFCCASTVFLSKAVPFLVVSLSVCPQVSFPMFESWWKTRAGIGDTDMVVIPEFISERLTSDENGQMMDFNGRRRRHSVQGSKDWHMNTVWVGGIEDEAAKPANVTKLFAQLAEVHSVNLRLKPGGRSWAVVSFCHREDAAKLLAGGFELPAGAKHWTIKEVKPEKMQSLQVSQRLLQL